MEQNFLWNKEKNYYKYLQRLKVKALLQRFRWSLKWPFGQGPLRLWVIKSCEVSTEGCLL